MQASLNPRAPGSGVTVQNTNFVRQHQQHPGLDRRGEASKPVSLQVYTHYDKGYNFEAPGARDHLTVLKISYADYSKRPARKQVEERKATIAADGCEEYNIWYDRWMGDNWKENKELVAAPHRCNIRKDSGRTKAETRFGETAYCCLFFAKGQCAMGPDCTFLHRIPGEDDEKRLDMLHDIFGRQKHNTDRDDMRGVGNFNRNNRTLYIGGLKLLRGAEATHKSILRHFSEFGEVEQLRLIPSKSIAFVRYKLRCCAEFALEAMHCQTLDEDELLNIRWAFDDPNPRAQQIERQRLEKQVEDHLKQMGIDITDTDFYHPGNYSIEEMPEAKRMRLEGEAVGQYPQTDHQYAYLQGSVEDHASSAAVGGVMTKEEADAAAARQQAAEAQNKLASLLDGIGEGGAADYSNKRKHEEISVSSTPTNLPHPWYEARDAEGHIYYVNSETQQTQWEYPSVQSIPGYTEEQITQYAQYYGMSVEAARDWLQKNQGSAAAGAGGQEAELESLIHEAEAVKS